MSSRLGQWGRRAGALLPPWATAGFGRPAVLTFHGVSARALDPWLHVSHHTAERFAAIVRGLKSHFDVLPWGQLDAARADPLRHRRSVFLASDDGYANVLATAAPILDDLPFALFLSTHHIDSREPEPSFLVRLFFATAPEGSYLLPHLPELALYGDAGRRILCATVTAMMKALDLAQARETVEAMHEALRCEGVGDVLARYREEGFLDWSGVRELTRRGVVIGAHAHVHWPLNIHQSAETLSLQTHLPKALIERHVGACAGFAYPHGNIGDVAPAAWRLVRDRGYRAGFTTLSGTLDAGDNPFLLPRYSIGLTETHVASLVPLLAVGNTRVADFNRALEA